MSRFDHLTFIGKLSYASEFLQSLSDDPGMKDEPDYFKEYIEKAASICFLKLIKLQMQPVQPKENADELNQ